MQIERASVAGSAIYNAWVAVMENHTRVMEANCQGESFLLCFSAEIEKMAKDYCRRRGIRNPVSVVPSLLNQGFALVQDQAPERFGLSPNKVPQPSFGVSQTSMG